VAIDEAWKTLMTDAAGAWLNEWARRTRHIETALLVITQHLADFDNPQGVALLRNSVLRLIFRTSPGELAGVKDALALHPEDLEAITRLETRKGEYSTCLLDSEAHGRAQVQLRLGDMEYWVCSADPHRDQPLRLAALREAGGDPWDALKRLVDPAWHRDRATGEHA
jgi:type IV secretory pathway VirB4 component